ncbi:hypothetical protein F5X99DRAFT_398022 [Biscogniauxia marginata]|nr:hypothetical protein F5X99DRAFT_398022 [Biscogniauxia marginata]
MALEFPTIYLLPTHLEADELPELETQIPSLTYDISEAQVVLGKISRKARALFELRTRGILTDEVAIPLDQASNPDTHSASPPAKRRKLSSPAQGLLEDGTSTASDTSESSGEGRGARRSGNRRRSGLGKVESLDSAVKTSRTNVGDNDELVQVVRLTWFTDSVTKGVVLPVDDYLIYQGRKKQVIVIHPMPSPGCVPQRDGEEGDNKHSRTAAHAKVPPLLEETTSEHDRAMNLPPVPDYLNTAYSCQRPTRYNSPNNAFIEKLKKMRTIRTLEGDEVGVRAYSTSIAAVAAYPYLISDASEVVRLPGCGAKIALLFRQWKANGYLDDVKKAELDPKLSVLKLFYEIWGVAATTAREFYNRGWRDLDDIVEHGWDTISRVQQIGVKYYKELQEKIPCAEVESIGQIILSHANELREGYQMVIAGGYRRGKAASGDVDVILSHPDASATHYFISDIVGSLERDKFVTHTLTISNKNSERGQAPVAWKGQEWKARGGFDTLDKALVVWQDPIWDRSAATENPNPHRRVDIIISPWKTAGCAVVGWTGGTTFERDLRRYCNHEKHLKFDSSGVRTRTDGGEWVDLESDSAGRPAPDMLTAEKRVFQGLGLKWLPPEERCTG